MSAAHSDQPLSLNYLSSRKTFQRSNDGVTPSAVPRSDIYKKLLFRWTKLPHAPTCFFVQIKSIQRQTHFSAGTKDALASLVFDGSDASQNSSGCEPRKQSHPVAALTWINGRRDNFPCADRQSFWHVRVGSLVNWQVVAKANLISSSVCERSERTTGD